MIKEKYGIEITKPWSSEMYDWNDKVLEDLKKKITKLWKQGYASALEDYKELDQDMKFEDSD